MRQNNVTHKTPMALALIAAVLAGLILWFRVGATGMHQTMRLEGYNVPESPAVRAKQAFSVALVTVADIGTARWNTKDGNAPISGTSEENGDIPVIYEPVTLRVDTSLKHSLNQSEIMIRKVGGTVGDVTMHSLGGLELREGQKAVVFFTRELPVGTWKYSSIYTVDGTTAKSTWDRKELPLNSLLTEIAQNSK